MFPSRIPVTWQLYAGDDSSITLTFTNNRLPMSLPATGWKSQWRRDRDASQFVEIEVDTSAASLGRITLRLTGEQTRTLLGKGVYDLEQTDESRTYIQGITSCVKDVTRE